MLLDCSVSEQSYVEDCEICCNPIRISYRADSGAVEQFEASELGQ